MSAYYVTRAPWFRWRPGMLTEAGDRVLTDGRVEGPDLGHEDYPVDPSSVPDLTDDATAGVLFAGLVVNSGEDWSVGRTPHGWYCSCGTAEFYAPTMGQAVARAICWAWRLA